MRLPYTIFTVASEFVRRKAGAVLRGARGAPQWKMCPSAPPPPFWPSLPRLSLKYRPVISLTQLQNTPVISLIQLHIVPPVPPAGIVAPHWPHLASARTAPEASAIAICSPISAFQWSQNAWPWMTLTGYFALNYVFAPLCLAESVRPSKNNCANTNRHTTKWQKSSTRTLVYGNVKITPIFAGVL